VRGSEHVHPIVSRAFGERIVIDLKDFHAYVNGQQGAKRYLMVIIDHFSSWVEVCFLKDKTAAAVWSKMFKYLSRSGVPTIIHSDNGGEFELCVLDSCSFFCDSANRDHRIAQYATRFGYKVARGAARHPESQGKVERWNRTVGTLLAARHAELGSPSFFKWWEHVHAIALNHNFSKCEASNASPYQVFFTPP
jgi:hypothetical protein